MTAEEALKLSTTGFIWNQDGYPAFRAGKKTFMLGDYGLVGTSIDSVEWFPESPKRSPEDTCCISEVEELREKVAQQQREYLALEEHSQTLAKLLYQQTPTPLKRNSLSELPNSARHVAIWDGLELLGSGWSYCGIFREWNYNFQIKTERLPFYYWTELPRVES